MKPATLSTTAPTVVLVGAVVLGLDALGGEDDVTCGY
jgi:hypothetical protein